METIKFQSSLKKYSINGDENCVIAFNPADPSILQRLQETVAEIEQLQNIISNDAEGIVKADKVIRDKLDYVFNSQISNTVFGNTNCLTLAGGSPLAFNFIEAVTPIIKSEIQAEQKKSEKKMSKYIDNVKALK